MVPTMHQALASYRSAVAQPVSANATTGWRSTIAVAHALQACLSPLVIHRGRAIHPIAHECAIAALDNGLTSTLHKVEQVVDVMHR